MGQNTSAYQISSKFIKDCELELEHKFRWIDLKRTDGQTILKQFSVYDSSNIGYKQLKGRGKQLGLRETQTQGKHREHNDVRQ